MIDEYFIGTKFFGELEPKERRKALFDFLNFVSSNRNLTKGEIIRNYATLNKTTENRVKKLDDLAYFSGLTTLAQPWITPKADKILKRGYIIPSDYADAPEWVIKTMNSPPKKVKIRGKYIGSDKSTTYSIYYHPLTNKYFLQDAEGNFKGWLDKINITLTYSLDTNTTKSHQRLVLEATAWTLMEKKSPEEIDDIITELDDFLVDAIAYYFNAGVADIAVKEGVEYQSEPEGIIAKYPQMRCLLLYHHGRRERAKRIEKTKTDFELEKSKNPKRPHPYGRPKSRSLTRFIR